VEMNRILSALAVAALFINTPVSARILAECGAFKGYSYFFEGRFVSKEKSGWSKDKISVGSTSITEVNGEYDVIFTDVLSKNRSSRADGAKVYLVSQNEGAGIKTFFVLYSGRSNEFYVLNTKMKKLILLQIKYGALINKTTMLVADCN
jgi:hypothetical protein